MTAKTPASPIDMMKEIIRKRMESIQNRIAVISGKGGVGKSFISSAIALILSKRGKRVAILDADIHGPSIPKIMGIRGSMLYVNPEGELIPVVSPGKVAVVSIELLLTDPDLPVIWRGPLKTRAIYEFLSRVLWGELDYLVIDLPPGTGDEPLTIAQAIPSLSGAVIVTAPSDLSRVVVRKAAMFCRELGVKILGIVENMSEFTCPVCGTTHKLFGSGVGMEMAKELGVEFLGSVPLDPRISEAIDRGELHKIIDDENIPAVRALNEIVSRIEAQLEQSRSS